MNRAVGMLLIVLAMGVTARGSNVGDTYQQVLKEKGEPKSQMNAGSIRVLTYPDETLKLKDDVVVSIKVLAAPTKAPATPQASANPLSPEAQIALVKRQLDDAVAKVRQIVNQEVTPLPRDPTLQMWEYYFHPGATRPDFDTVDVRATQETPYEEHSHYILWQDGRADQMWDGSQLAFNSMTKYFYTDRSVPKKKLTNAELLEINRLYRVIGQCERQLGLLGYQGPVP